jgi:uncharacterized protein YqgV (UPF0045/DUF77 family)
MKVSVDISMYPLTEAFEAKIISFIEKLRESSFVIKENPLTTQIYGDYDEVMDFIKLHMKEAFEETAHCVFVMKFIHGDRS